MCHWYFWLQIEIEIDNSLSSNQKTRQEKHILYNTYKRISRGKWKNFMLFVKTVLFVNCINCVSCCWLIRLFSFCFDLNLKFNMSCNDCFGCLFCTFCLWYFMVILFLFFHFVWFSFFFFRFFSFMSNYIESQFIIFLLIQ